MLAGKRSTIVSTIRRKTSVREDDSYSVNRYISCLRSLGSSDSFKSPEAAVVWERKSGGYRITDLCCDRYAEATWLILECFLRGEPMCRSTQLFNDAASVKMYLNLILNKMSETSSLCAIQEGTGKLVGVLVASTNKKDHREPSPRARAQLRQGEAFLLVTDLINYVVGISHIYKESRVNKCFFIHVLCVEPEYQRAGIGTALVRSCVAQAKTFTLDSCVGVFSSGASQTIAKRLGFDLFAEVPYKDYRIPNINENPLGNPGPGNYSVTCMGLSIASQGSPSLVATTPDLHEGSFHSTLSTKTKKKHKVK